MHSALNGTFLPCTTLVPTNISSFTWLPAPKLNAFVLHTICRVTFSFQTETQVRFTLRTNAAHILVPWAFYCQCEYPLTSSCHLGSPHDQLYCTSCSYLHITSILLAPIGSYTWKGCTTQFTMKCISRIMIVSANNSQRLVCCTSHADKLSLNVHILVLFVSRLAIKGARLQRTILVPVRKCMPRSKSSARTYDFLLLRIVRLITLILSLFPVLLCITSNVPCIKWCIFERVQHSDPVPCTWFHISQEDRSQNIVHMFSTLHRG